MELDASTTIWLEKYKMTRNGIQEALKVQQGILNWTSVAVGVILLFSVQLYILSPRLTFWFYTIALPSASISFMNIWLSEVARMDRYTRYLLKIEELLQEIVGNDLKLWEHWLKEKDDDGNAKYITFGHKSALSVYLGVVLFSHIAANIILWGNKYGHDIETDWKILFTFLTVLFNIWAIMNAYQLIKRYIRLK